MVQAAVLRLPSIVPRLPFQVIEAFPAGFSAIHLAGLDYSLNDKTLAELRVIEWKLRNEVDIALILRARTQRGMEQAIIRAFKIASEYYIESGMIIWRALNDDYSRLLQLSRVSMEAVEKEFFRHSERLEREIFIKVVAGIRVFGKVGEWVILDEGGKELAKREPPMDYLMKAVIVTFLTSCFLTLTKGDIKGVRASNLTLLAQELVDIVSDVYQVAVQRRLHESAGEEQYWYWSPHWQEGEVEADLDKNIGDVKRFASIEDLILDLG